MENRYKLKKPLYVLVEPDVRLLWMEGSIFKISNIKDGIIFIGSENEKLAMLTVKESLFLEYFELLK